MSSGGELLRMLMPAVSPVPTKGPGAAPRSVPIESRGFDSLLDEARLADPGPQPVSDGAQTAERSQDPGTKQADAVDSFLQLSGIESIHNASLRRIVADAASRR